MRVKVGDQWHEVTAQTAICIEMSAADRTNILNMDPDATKYAVFADEDPRDRDAKLKWMD